MQQEDVRRIMRRPAGQERVVQQPCEGTNHGNLLAPERLDLVFTGRQLPAETHCPPAAVEHLEAVDLLAGRQRINPNLGFLAGIGGASEFAPVSVLPPGWMSVNHDLATVVNMAILNADTDPDPVLVILFDKAIQNDCGSADPAQRGA